MTEHKKVRVERIKIRNILGIDTLEIEPGTVTVIEGKNAEGKTSVLEAIRALTVGGHDATLLRKGEEDGETVLLLDSGAKARKHVQPHKSDLRVNDPTVGAVGAAKTYIDELRDRLSDNPLDLMHMKPAERVQAVLESMPLEVSAEELAEAVGDVVDLDDIDTDDHALTVIQAVRDRVFGKRTGVNRLAREHDATVKQLEGTVGEVEDDDPGEEIERLEAERDAVAAERREAMDEINAEMEKDLEVARTEHDDAIESLRKQIRALERERDAAVEEVKEGARKRKDAVDKKAAARLSETREKVATLRERQKAQAQAQQAREALEAQRAKLEERRAESEALTDALERLDALKGKLAERMPIEGIEIRDDIYRDGIPFPRLETSAQVKACCRVAKARVGDLGLIPVDGLECLDTERFNAFVEEMKADDSVQWVFARVTDDDLTVRTEPAEVA